MPTAYLAKSPEGNVRVDYRKDGQELIETFELISGGILQTTFNSNGEILDQSLLKPERRPFALASEFVSGFASEAVETAYKEVEFRKQCPSCKNTSLKRGVERLSSAVPVMPIYICNSCNSKGFHLTDAYLSRLVQSNRQLFTAEEAKELDTNSAAFVKELREYIIRIFASKKILKIQ